MIALSSRQMRDVEAYLFKNCLADSFELMCRAGTELARHALDFKTVCRGYAVFAGKGNNSGDGFIAACCLSKSGMPVSVYLIYPPEFLSGDAKKAFQKLDPIVNIHIGLPRDPRECENVCILDCLLGTGFSGQLRAPYPDWIEYINRSGCPIVSADLPSGLNPDDGTIEDNAVHANLTVTFGTAKKGLLLKNGPKICGKLVIADIGIPKEVYHDCQGTIPFTCKRDVRPCLNPLKPDIYKHQRGHALVFGGSSKYPYAPLLAGEAALRCTAGLVTVFLPYGVPVSSNCSHALMVSHDIAERSPRGVLSEKSADALLDYRPSAIAVGMGLGQAEDASGFLRSFLKRMSTLFCPVLIDADALTILATDSICREWLLNQKRTCPIVLTPHEGEMKRLEDGFGMDSTSDRIARAQKLSEKTNAYIVFKGQRTIIANPDGTYTLNLSGSPVLATAGSGDVLSGIIVSMLASGMNCFDACRCGVFLHGVCGELAQIGPFPMPGVIADDLVAKLPEAFNAILYD